MMFRGAVVINRPTPGSIYNLYSPCVISLTTVLTLMKATGSWKVSQRVYKEGTLTLVKAGESRANTIPNDNASK